MFWFCKSCNQRIKTIFESDDWESVAVAVTRKEIIDGDYFGFGNIDGVHIPHNASVYHAKCYETSKRRHYEGPTEILEVYEGA